MTEPQQFSKRKKAVLTLATLGIALLLLEVAGYAVIALGNSVLSEPVVRRSTLLRGQTDLLTQIVESPQNRDQIHPTRGWHYRAGFARSQDTINAAGIRARREYAPVPDSAGGTRIAAFGDSFVYCTEVANDECWASHLEAGWLAEALNYGVGGYGTDQAFLRYLEEGDDLAPEVVLIGFAPVNLRRAVNRYRRFLSQGEGPWFKPRFELVGNELSLIPTPVGTVAQARALIDDPSGVSAFGEDDFFYEPAIYEHGAYEWSAMYRLLTGVWMRVKRRSLHPDRLFDGAMFRTESTAFRVQTAILTAFVDSVATSGARPVLLFLPGREDVSRQIEGLAVTYDPLKALLVQGGAEAIDPVSALAAAPGTEGLFARGGHYSSEGNAILARTIAEFLNLPERDE